MIVDDWREIGPESLKLWHDEHAPSFRRAAVTERLTNAYWIARARTMLAAKL